MSFEVVCHEHPNIFVVNRQIYETYRFTVDEDGALAHDEPRSDLEEARRTPIALLARGENRGFPRRWRVAFRGRHRSRRPPHGEIVREASHAWIQTIVRG